MLTHLLKLAEGYSHVFFNGLWRRQEQLCRIVQGPRSPRLYIKALVLKEVCMVSLRYAEGLSTAYFSVPKSTLHYWERRHGDIVERVLRILSAS